MRSTPVALALAAAAVALLGVPEADASHLRGGSFWMEPTGTPWEARFGGTLHLEGGPAAGTCYTYGGYGADLWPEGDAPGAVPVTLDLCVLHKDAEGWTVNRLVAPGTAADYVHAYPSAGPWRPFVQPCFRMQYGAHGEQVVNMQPGSDATVCQRLASRGDLAVPNQAPRAFAPPVVRCTAGAVCTFPVSATDPDGDALTFRAATSEEYAGATGTYFHPGPPFAPAAATVDAAGVFSWDTAGAAMADSTSCTSCTRTLYSVQVVVEDGRTASPVDFFVELVPDATAPAWVAPPTPCGGTVAMTPGVPATVPIRLAHPDAPALQVYVDPTTPLAALPGATLTSPPPSNPLERTLAWTPPAGSEGVHRLRFQGHAAGSYAPPCDVAVHVLPPPVAAPLLVAAACAGEPTRWSDGSSPGHPSAPLDAAAWDWGDGTATDAAPGASLTHIYAEPGDHTVRLRVRDALGREAEAAATVRVCDPPPVLEPIPDLLLRQGERGLVCPAATDPVGGAVAFAATGPAGVRAASLEPFCLEADAGRLGLGTHGPVRVEASDGTTTVAVQFWIHVLHGGPPAPDADRDGVADAADACAAVAGPAGGCPAAPAPAQPASTEPPPSIRSPVPPLLPLEEPPADAAPAEGPWPSDEAGERPAPRPRVRPAAAEPAAPTAWPAAVLAPAALAALALARRRRAAPR